MLKDGESGAQGGEIIVSTRTKLGKGRERNKVQDFPFPGMFPTASQMNGHLHSWALSISSSLLFNREVHSVGQADFLQKLFFF